MSHSLNEIEALAKRAARGAGMPWGLAEEAAKCTRWLASFDLPGPHLLAEYLEIYDTESTLQTLNGIWSADAALCPIATGATLSDCASQFAQAHIFEIRTLAFPLLIVPFAAGAAAQQNLLVSVEWGDVTLVIDGTGLAVKGSPEELTKPEAAQVTCQVSATSLPLKTAKIRGQMEAASLEILNKFAFKTYAPATDASRDLGAGAGNSDND